MNIVNRARPKGIIQSTEMRERMSGGMDVYLDEGHMFTSWLASSSSLSLSSRLETTTATIKNTYKIVGTDSSVLSELCGIRPQAVNEGIPVV
jgi:lipoate-protein ligase A